MCLWWVLWSVSTASRVAKVSMTIISLSATMINMPQFNVEIRTTQQAFYEMYKFLRVIGCIDGTHIRIQSPDKLKLCVKYKLWTVTKNINDVNWEYYTYCSY